MTLRFSRIFLYTALFSVIVVMPSTFFPFIGVKDYFFRITVELALIFFVLWWGYESKKGEAIALFRDRTSHPLFLAVSFFVLAFLIASVFAYDPKVAFWSNYERGEGGFQMLHYYIFFTLMVVLFNHRKHWKLAFNLSMIAAILMIAYGLLGYLSVYIPDLFCSENEFRKICLNFITPFSGGKPPTTFKEIFLTPRFQGSLGNPAYVGAYLLFIIFYALYLFVSNFRTKKLISFLYLLGALIFLIFFSLSQTRGAFLGLILGAFGFFSYLILRIRRKKKRIKIFVFFLIFLSIMAISYIFRDTPFIKNLPGGRLFQLSFNEQTIQTRLWTWKSAFKGFMERPITGWGPENFNMAFDKYFDPRHFKLGQGSETWFDRAHNVFLDYLVEAGLFGFLSYLSIFIVFYYFMLRLLFKKRLSSKSDEYNVSHKTIFLEGLLFAIFLAYLGQGIALFDVLPIYLGLFVTLAFSIFWFKSYPKIELS